MNASRPRPIPEVYVLWHPACGLGELLARRIHTWLRPGNGLGPQVYYRSLKAPEAPAGGLPPPLPGESRPGSEGSRRSRISNVQIVLPLLDAHLVADAAWRQWLTQLGANAASCHRVFLPVALDATAFNVPSPLRELNFLRPSGLPPTTAGPVDAAVLEPAVRSLIKQLTEALCRFMLVGQAAASGPEKASHGPPVTDPAEADGMPKLKIFLSHAKADGTTPARRLRDYIYSQTQLAAFYDENDIAFGSVFSRVLQTDLRANETAALIAVRTARYATRPWCRREVAQFRRPGPDPLPGQAPNRWRLHPTLVVDALEAGKQTAGIPELGNSPCIRWNDGAPDQEEQVITTVLRDVMLGAFHSACAAAIAPAKDQIILNWIPDPTTLLHLPDVRQGRELQLIHPGRGMSGLELDVLSEFFGNLTFRSFEETLT